MKKIWILIVCLGLIVSLVGSTLAADSEEKNEEKLTFLLISDNRVYIPAKYKVTFLTGDTSSFYLKDGTRITLKNFDCITTSYENAMKLCEKFKENNYLIFE